MPETDYDTRVGAYALVLDDQQRILLTLWNEGGDVLWSMPGGGIELYETPTEGLVREIFEETGYDARVGELQAVDVSVVPAGSRERGIPLRHVRILYRAEITGGELRPEVGGSTDEARWFTLDEAAALPHVAMVDIALGIARDRLLQPS